MANKEVTKNVKAKGTISLEAVLSFPLILMVIFIFISAIHMEQDAIILSHALDQTAHEVALLMPLTDLAEQYIDPKEWIEKVIPDKTLADIAYEGLSDVAATVLGSPFLLARLDTWARATAVSQQRMPPQGKRKMAVDIDHKRQAIWLCLSYENDSIFSDDWRQIRSRVPLWNAHLFEKKGSEDDEEDQDTIWSMPNFDRGLEIRRIFGGNLPATYPVLAGWNGHEALAIKSMDWTAPSWSTASAVKSRVNQFVNNLAACEGSGDGGPSPGEIQSKRLVLVIPDNEVAWKSEGLLASWKAEALLKGVTLDIREYGTSHAYEPAD
jgi:hypothetical protein